MILVTLKQEVAKKQLVLLREFFALICKNHAQKFDFSLGVFLGSHGGILTFFCVFYEFVFKMVLLSH